MRSVSISLICRTVMIFLLGVILSSQFSSNSYAETETPPEKPGGSVASTIREPIEKASESAKAVEAKGTELKKMADETDAVIEDDGEDLGDEGEELEMPEEDTEESTEE